VTDIDASERSGGEDQPPRVFISYSDDSAAHGKRVLELAQWLRSHGVDAQIDQFEESPEEGWPRWIYRQIREAEFVLIIATPGYLRRCESDEPRADATGSATKFGSHLTLQELHEAGGRNRKFVPVLFGGDAIVESVPLPLRGATCYRLPDQRDDLYRRLTGQPKVQRAPLGVLKTFDDDDLLDSSEDGGSYLPEPLAPLARGRASVDEQLADDSLQAVVDAGIVDDPESDRIARPRPRRRRSRRQWLITVAAFGVTFMSVGLFVGRRVLVPKTDPICRIQLTDADGNVVEGIDRVDLELPSGHLVEVVVEDGRTLRFACPPDRVQAQAHVFLDAPKKSELATVDPPSSDVPPSAEIALRIDGRVALPASAEIGEEIARAQFVKVIPARPIRAREPAPEPVPYPSKPGPSKPDPSNPGSILGNLEIDDPGSVQLTPLKRVRKVTSQSKLPALQKQLSAHAAVFESCYERGLAQDPSLRGELVGDVRLDPTGKLELSVTSNDFSRKNPELVACVRRQIESWKIKPTSSRATVHPLSIEFEPQLVPAE